MRLLSSALIIAVLISGCGQGSNLDSASSSRAEASDTAEQEVTAEVAPTRVDATTTTSLPASSTTTAPAPEPVPTGREALAANSGKAHVLWFWGAH